MSTHVIDLDGADRAIGTVYCHGEIEAGARWIHQAIVYDDTSARRDGRWYFVRRRHRLFYGAEAAVNPRTLPPAEWPAHHDGRGTLPDEWPTWQQFWAGGALSPARPRAPGAAVRQAKVSLSSGNP